jgi:hypothetical protein
MAPDKLRNRLKVAEGSLQRQSSKETVAISCMAVFLFVHLLIMLVYVQGEVNGSLV